MKKCYWNNWDILITNCIIDNDVISAKFLDHLANYFSILATLT